MLITISYIKYTEKIGLELVSKYFGFEKIKQRLTELGVSPDEEQSKVGSLYKTVIHFLVWLLIGIALVFIKNHWL